MRLPAAFAVFLLFAAGGLVRGAELRRRCRLLEELRRMYAELGAAISSTAPTLEELAESCGGVFGELLRQSRESSPDIRHAWSAAAEALAECSFCGGEEAALLRELAHRLGTSSAQGQLALLELHTARLGRLCAEAEESFRSKGKLYRSVGALLGAGAAVLIL